MADGIRLLDAPIKDWEHQDPLGWERECLERALEVAGAARLIVIGQTPARDRQGEPGKWLVTELQRWAHR